MWAQQMLFVLVVSLLLLLMDFVFDGNIFTTGGRRCFFKPTSSIALGELGQIAPAIFVGCLLLVRIGEVLYVR